MTSTGTGARRVTTYALGEIRRGAGFHSRRVTAEPASPLDPFVSFEHFHMTEPTFAPHPHAGLSAVTYLFERSDGALVSRESSGVVCRIDPGAVRWMEAGRGMMHEESPLERGRDCHGIQILVNLAAADKSVAPRFFHLQAQEVPELAPHPGARVRVLCGEAGGVQSPFAPCSPVTLLDVFLAPGVAFAQTFAADHDAFVVVLEGRGEVGLPPDAVPLDPDTAAAFSARGDTVVTRAGEAGLHVLIAAGRPFGEPVVFEGPFVMTSHEEIVAAWARHAAGEMGRLRE
jgi:redox-sensitive bicupin YhaK (pirin superfamily)